MTEGPAATASTGTAGPDAVRDLTRRRFLSIGGVAGLGVGLGLVAVACGGDDTTGSTSTSGDATTTTGDSTATSGPTTSDTADTTSGTPAETVFTAADFAALGTCLVLPELTGGPFPSPELIERRDIREDRPGTPLRVGIQVVDEACEPIPGAQVEIWHCDVDGDYSAYADGDTAADAGEGTTFLRGMQTTNDEGIVELWTNYPGWYTGRAVHIHAEVHIDDTTVLTTQFIFDEELNGEVLTSGEYAAYGLADTSNAADDIAAGNDDLLMTAEDDADIGGLRALIVVGVDPDATSSATGGRGGPGGGGGPGDV